MATKIVPLVRKKGGSKHELSFGVYYTSETAPVPNRVEFKFTRAGKPDLEFQNFKFERKSDNLIVIIGERKDRDEDVKDPKNDEGGVGSIVVTINGNQTNGSGGIGDPPP